MSRLRRMVSFSGSCVFLSFPMLLLSGDNRKAAKAECICGIPARAGTDGAFFHSSFGIEDFVEVCFHMYLVSALRRESFEGFQEFFSVFFGDILQAVRCLLQGAHVLEAHFHVRRDLLVLAFPDEVGNGGDVRQDFAHEEGFLARPAEALREDVLQAGGKDAPDFVFLVEGNAWMMRVHASLARVVWRVAKTRWPVSAAVRAASMVAASRISPTAMMSGSSLRDSMTPSAKLGVSSPISLWWTRALSEEMTYSTGSSRVTIWQGRLATAVRRMCASVVLLPLPEGL